MQSNRTRALVALGSIVAIVALLIVFAGGSDDDGDQTTVAETTTTTTKSGTENAGKPEKKEKPNEPEGDVIVVKGGEPDGGVQDLTFTKGDEVAFEVRSDTADEVHVHGYDLSEDVDAGGKVKFKFPADIDGVFEVELEASGVQLAQLTVKP